MYYNINIYYIYYNINISSTCGDSREKWVKTLSTYCQAHHCFCCECSKNTSHSRLLILFYNVSFEKYFSVWKHMIDINQRIKFIILSKIINNNNSKELQIVKSVTTPHTLHPTYTSSYKIILLKNSK